MTTPGDRVFNGADLRATLFNPAGDKLIVTFRHRTSQDGAFSTPKPVRRFVDRKYAHLHLQSRLNDWYINAETEAFERRLQEISKPFGRVVATGFSMGGYAVMRFSRALGVKHAILISPQFSIAPSVVPFDKRYRDNAAGFDPVLGDVASRARRRMTGVILVDPFRKLDMRNTKLIGRAFPRLSVCRLAGGGHPATGVLAETTGFGPVQAKLLSGRIDPSEILALHRAKRHGSAAYWMHLAKAAEKSGRADLAVLAQGRAATLEAHD